MRHAPHVFAALALCLLLGFPLSDMDIWWHLAAGREMVSLGTWLRTDPFCVSSLGTPWIDLHWGFQLLLFSTRSLLGDAGLVVLRIVFVWAALAIALRGRISWECAALAGLVVFASRSLLDLRPLLPTLVCIALLWVLLDAPRSRWNIFGILASQVVMANVQGLFLLGPLVCIAHAIGNLLEGDRRAALREGLLVPAMLLASLANPWGTGAFELATRVAGRIVPSAGNVFSQEISENLPLLDWIRESPSRALPLAWSALGVAWLWKAGPGVFGRALLLGGMAILALMATRNLPLLAVASLLCVQPRTVGARWPGIIAGVSILVLAATTAVADRRWSLPGDFASPFQAPGESIRHILSSHPAKVFHELRLGGWLAWNMPHLGLCWADTRLVLHDKSFLRSVLEATDHPERFDAWSSSQGFQYALLPVAAWPRNRPLVAHLLHSPSWTTIDADGSWILFARLGTSADAGTVRPFDLSMVDARIRRRFGGNPRLEALVRREWLAVSALGELPR